MKSAAIYFMILRFCAYSPDEDRYIRDCETYESAEPATYDDCEKTARWHRETTPAGLRVIAHACTFARGVTREMAKR